MAPTTHIEPMSDESGSYAHGDAYPESNCFFVSASRHDRDRLEVQLGFDGLVKSKEREFIYDVDLVMFVPKTLGLLDIDDSVYLRQEFQSYIRLHTHASNPDSEASSARLKERLELLRATPDKEHTRLLAVEYEAFLRAQSKRVRKEIRKLPQDAALEGLIESEIESVRSHIGEFRTFLREQGIERRRPDEFAVGTREHDLSLANEYISHLYSQYLSRAQLAARQEPLAIHVLESLNELGAQEAALRADCRFLLDRSEGGDKLEDTYLRRIGVLKKYFQKTIFVEVRGRSLHNRMLIPVYALAAALAASWAVMVQIYQAKTIEQRVGINSIALIAFGVIAYVLKDLMKDYARRWFLHTSRIWFPDYEKKLFIKRQRKRIALGEIHEFIRTFDSEHLPTTLKRARYSVPGGEMEESLHEDVLHFRKIVELDLGALETKKEFPWGVREIVRVRFDRLLVSMEDAFKPMHLLTPGGEAVSRQGHRIYHVYLACWIRKSAQDKGQPARSAFKAFKVTLDKTGVLACEPAGWKPDNAVPEIPK